MASLVMLPSDPPSTITSPMVLEHNAFHTVEVVDSMLSPTPSTLRASQENKKNDEFINCSRKNMKRLLRFHATTSTLWIENTNDMSDVEIDACYYSSRDYSYFRDRERRLSRNCSNWWFIKGGRKGDLLGVETPLQRFHRRERSRNAIFAVILEQELRQEHNQDSDSLTEEDSLGIACVYQQYTNESARLARERALANASQVDRTTSLSTFSTMESIRKNDIGNCREDEHVTARQHDPPWEVPLYNINCKTNIRPSAMIKYTSCYHRQEPGHCLDMLHFEEQDISRKPFQHFQDFRYEDQFNLQGRERKNENIHEETLVYQKFNRMQDPNEHLQFSSQRHAGFQPSRQHLVNGEKERETIIQKSMWDPIPCDLVSPSDGPSFRHGMIIN